MCIWRCIRGPVVAGFDEAYGLIGQYAPILSRYCSSGMDLESILRWMRREGWSVKEVRGKPTGDLSMLKKKKKKLRRPTGKAVAREGSSRRGSTQSRSSMDRVQRAAAYGRGTDRMQWIPGQTYWCRILPIDASVIDHPLVVPPIGSCSYPAHRGLPIKDEEGKDNLDRPFLCLDNARDNRKCPACEYVKIITATGQQSDAVDAKALKKEAHHMVNLLIRGDQPRIYRQKFGVKIFGALKTMAEEMGDITDERTGIDLQLETGVWKTFTFPKLAGLTKQRPIGDDIPWRTTEEVTKSLEYVKKFGPKAMTRLLIQTYGRIEEHTLFGGN